MFDDEVAKITMNTGPNIQTGDCDFFFKDPYRDMYTNLETYYQCLVDIECAIRDFLKENSYQILQYRDLTDARLAIEITHNRWVYMLRKYMSKYYP